MQTCKHCNPSLSADEHCERFTKRIIQKPCIFCGYDAEYVRVSELQVDINCSNRNCPDTMVQGKGGRR